MKNTIKVFLSILLILCLLDLPYGYYQFVRIAATIGFAYLAFAEDKSKNRKEFFVFIALAILFQPFIKIALGRFVWNIVDILVACGLILSILIAERK